MSEFIYYNTGVVTHADNDDLPGIKKFRKFFSIYPQSSVFIDRTGTVKIPVKTASIYPIPVLRPFKKSYAELCIERAHELLARADTLNLPIYVSWSGGIDSTTLLVALLQVATDAQRARITVLLTEDSIAEYPAFFADHIRGKLTCDSASLFPYLLGTNNLLIVGENNDQVFGSDVIGRLLVSQGPASIHKPYSRDVFHKFFAPLLGNDAESTTFCLDLFERLAAAAPVQLNTNFEYLWWLNFNVKWQFVATRMIPYVTKRNTAGARADFLGTRFDQFFNTEDFQLWSMTNPDKKIKDAWNTYKWPAKDFIYEYTKDADYRDNKQKRGSLGAVLQQQPSFNFVDRNFTYFRTLDAAEWYNPKNDFV